MRGRIAAAFADWLEAGGRVIGEVGIEPLPGEVFLLRHVGEVGADDSLEGFTTPQDARGLAMLDDAGNYRPLKTAANLRHGWLLRLVGLEALCQAIDFFYPAALGVWAVGERLKVTPLRDTLERQSGMYAVTRKISDPAAQTVIETLCRSGAGCLKEILWEVRPGLPVAAPSRGGGEAFPLLCNEACNLLVAAIRDEVKKGS